MEANPGVWPATAITEEGLRVERVEPALPDDPLEVATRALEKLRAHGLPTVIGGGEDVVAPAGPPDNVIPMKPANPVLAVARPVGPEPAETFLSRRDQKTSFMLDGVLIPPPSSLDRQERSKKVDVVALRCQDILLLDEVPLVEKRQFEQAFRWLQTALEPSIYKICDRYTPTSRSGRRDFRQVIAEHLVTSILPQYKAERGPFIAYFIGTAWRRVQHNAYENASQLSASPSTVRKKDPEALRDFWQAVSYDGLAASATNYRDNEVPAEMLLPPSRVADPHESVIADEEMVILKAALATLSPLERDAFVDCQINHQKYEDCARRYDIDPKTVDNALQRARRKVLRHLKGQGY